MSHLLLPSGRRQVDQVLKSNIALQLSVLCFVSFVMDSFKNQPWGYSNQHVGQLTDDDFMAFFQKQFPGLSSTGPIPGFPPFNGVVNPQNVSEYSVSTLTPPASEDSSPSPSNSNQEVQEGGNEDPTLKRKASSNRLGNEPSNKTQHTGKLLVCLV